MRAKIYNSSRRHGSSLVETAAGMFLIIPVVFFFIDVGAAVLAQMANDGLAKQAARSAAQASSQATADSNAKTTVENYFSSQSSMYVVPPGGSGAPDTALVTPTNYNPMSGGLYSGVVTVTTNIVCNLPIPLGAISTVPFQATATEPILAKLPGSP